MCCHFLVFTDEVVFFKFSKQLFGRRDKKIEIVFQRHHTDFNHSAINLLSSLERIVTRAQQLQLIQWLQILELGLSWVSNFGV
jgi:16S rRNA A1518/A1519 N6-dimethyltransferase RsmA/KsgA/DIM1 with predicted DNA glycosylase/AP lyase activity